MLNKEILSEFDIFSDLDQDYLEAIAKHGELLDFKANDVIFHQDEEAANIYGVLEGEVELCLIFKDKILKTDIRYEESISTRVEIIEKPIIVETIGPREVFSWSSFVKPGRTTTVARCYDNSRIFSIPAIHLRALFQKEPSLGYSFMEKLCQIISYRLEHRTEKLIESWGEAFGVDRIEMNQERRKSVGSS